jgi:N-acetylmuramoyl-L-alanine amidase
VGQIIDGIVAQTCARHYFAPTQEHQFTSKIADRIESELNNLSVSGMLVSVHAQDFPDKGRGSWEKGSGADVYVSVVMNASGHTINKGMTIQSKWDDSTDRAGLAEQVGKMKKRTKSSYVWVYGPSSIAVVPSGDVHGGRLDFSHAMTVGELITDALRCREADPRLGRNLHLPIPQALTAMMEQLTVRNGLSLTLTDGLA